MCFAYAYSDGRGVSVNLFATREARDAAVRDMLSADFEGTDIEVCFAPDATAYEAWTAYVEHSGGPDFYLDFAEL